MPTIIKRGPYQWQAKIRRKGHALQSKTFPSKADALAWTRELESEMDRNVFHSRAEAERTTLTEALDRYAREVTPGKKGAAKELNRIKLWKARPLSARFLPAIKGADLAKHRDALGGKGAATLLMAWAPAVRQPTANTCRQNSSRRRARGPLWKKPSRCSWTQLELIQVLPGHMPLWRTTTLWKLSAPFMKIYLGAESLDAELALTEEEKYRHDVPHEHSGDRRDAVRVAVAAARDFLDEKLPRIHLRCLHHARRRDPGNPSSRKE